MWTDHIFQASGILLGQVLFFQWDFLWRMGVLVGVCALGTWVIIWVKRWRQDTIEQSSAAPQEQLDHFQKMVEEGLLHPDEFARIKGHMDKQSSESPSQPRNLSPPAGQSTDSSPSSM